MIEQIIKTVDGNEAAAHLSYYTFFYNGRTCRYLGCPWT